MKYICEDIVLKEITFRFVTNSDFVTESKNLKSVFKIILSDLEEYLKDNDIMDRYKLSLEESENIILTFISKEKPEYSKLYGFIGLIENSRQMIIELHTSSPELKYKKCYAGLCLMRTLVHEIFHLFFDDEQEVSERSDDFAWNMHFKNRFAFFEIWGDEISDKHYSIKTGFTH